MKLVEQSARNNFHISKDWGQIG